MKTPSIQRALDTLKATQNRGTWLLRQLIQLRLPLPAPYHAFSPEGNLSTASKAYLPQRSEVCYANVQSTKCKVYDSSRISHFGQSHRPCFLSGVFALFFHITTQRPSIRGSARKTLSVSLDSGSNGKAGKTSWQLLSRLLVSVGMKDALNIAPFSVLTAIGITMGGLIVEKLSGRTLESFAHSQQKLRYA